MICRACAPGGKATITRVGQVCSECRATLTDITQEPLYGEVHTMVRSKRVARAEPRHVRTFGPRKQEVSDDHRT